MTVMILSNSQDPHALAVMHSLSASGVTAELLDLSEFPTRLALSMAFEDGHHRFMLSRSGGGHLDLATVGAIWWRRPQSFRFPATLKDPVHCRFANSEATTAFQGLYQSLDAYWINDPVRDEAAHHKPWQLALAQQVGLTIPNTLMTSDPEEARAFWQRHNGNVIYKQFRALPDAWRETRRLRSEDAAFADRITVTPVIFQSFVDAVADIRVTVVGPDLFAAAADARNSAYPLDFRFNDDLVWKPHALPREVEDLLRALMLRLGLEYGAIDLRLTPDGEYVFLEINPAGQFLWIEMATGQPIIAALAHQLAHSGHSSVPELSALPAYPS